MCEQAAAQVRRRLAELELDMDRQQGWVRGGSKAEVRARTSNLYQALITTGENAGMKDSASTRVGRKGGLLRA